MAGPATTAPPAGRPSPNACSQGFRYWFWSLPFWFDLRIDGIDYLPDPLGFVLVARGAGAFGSFHRLLPSISGMAFLLAAVSILDVYDPSRTTFIPTEIGWFTGAVGLLLSVLQSILVWWMCQVVADFARRVHALETVEAAEQRRLVFVAWQVATAALLVVGMIVGSAPGGNVVLLGLLFMGVAALGILMELMMQAKTLCRGATPDFVPVAAPVASETRASAPA
jgi:hypothetical protein